MGKKLECIFCDSNDVEIDEIAIGKFQVRCYSCGAKGPILTTHQDAEREWVGKHEYLNDYGSIRNIVCGIE
jgi:hypothetical protein